MKILRMKLSITGSIIRVTDHYGNLDYRTFETFEAVKDISDTIKELEFQLFATMYRNYPSSYEVILTAPWEVN
jgi:hypothetical protein